MTGGREIAVRQAVERLGARLFARDRAIAEEFATDAVLVGSEAGERADGKAAIAALFASLMEKPRTVRLVWDSLDVTVAGDLAWIFAEGNALLAQDGEERAFPYRLSGVLSFQGGAWTWRLFHGSEPAG